MVPHLSNDEARYLEALTLGQHGPDFWNDNARQRLADKLDHLAKWAIKEAEARRRLRGEA